MSGAIVTPPACPGQDRWPRDNTHRPLGTLQGRWQVLGMGGCWGPPRGQNAGGGPGCLGVGPEGSDPASGAWLNEHATEPLHVPPPGAATDVPGGGSFRRHTGPCGGWGCVLFGFGLLVLRPVKEGGGALLKPELLASPRGPPSVAGPQGARGNSDSEMLARRPRYQPSPQRLRGGVGPFLPLARKLRLKRAEPLASGARAGV